MEAIDSLRTGIGLQGYGQRDPLVEYKKEAYRLFKELLAMVRKQIVYSIYKVGAVSQMPAGIFPQGGNLTFVAPAKTATTTKSAISQLAVQNSPQQKEAQSRETELVESAATHYQGQRVGRNDPCPCGSGKKFKQCHGK